MFEKTNDNDLVRVKRRVAPFKRRTYRKGQMRVRVSVTETEEKKGGWKNKDERGAISERKRIKTAATAGAGGMSESASAGRLGQKNLQNLSIEG